MGASGSGKTTMLRAMAGLEPFERGAIDVDGVALAGGSAGAGDARGRCAARSGWCSSSTACSSTCRRCRTCGWRRCTCSDVGRSGGGAARAGAARSARRRAPGARAAARAVGRRSAARGDCARAGDRPAGAADGRADRVARSRHVARSWRRSCESLVGRERRTLVIATHDEDFAREVARRRGRAVRMRRRDVVGRRCRRRTARRPARTVRARSLPIFALPLVADTVV